MMSMPSKDVHVEINKEQMLSCAVTLTYTRPMFSKHSLIQNIQQQVLS